MTGAGRDRAASTVQMMLLDSRLQSTCFTFFLYYDLGTWRKVVQQQIVVDVHKQMYLSAASCVESTSQAKLQLCN
jgi:hypothetical protein